jgi:maltose/moltooligosaccharide transporter
MKDRAIVPVAQLMLREFQASDFLMALLIGSVPAAFGMFLVPIISVRSDNHRGRWGRRIPFLLIPTPFIALAMVGLAYTPIAAQLLHTWLGTHSPGEAACRLIVFSFFWASFEIFQTIAQAVFTALITDVVPEKVIGRFFGLFRAVGLGAGIIFSLTIFPHASENRFWVFTGLGALYGVGFTLMCLMVKEGDYPPPAPKHQKLTFHQRFIAPISSYLRECFTQPFYLWIFLALMLGGLAGGPVNTFSLLYAKSIGLTDKSYGQLLAITWTCSLVLAYFLGWLADKIHPIRVGLFSITAYAGLMIWAGFAATTVPTFSVAFVAHGVLIGTFLTGTASLGPRLFPKAKFAQFASAAGILGALGYIIMPPAIGKFLDLTGHVYRHTFLLSGLIALPCAIAFIVVYRRFMRLGGPTGYTPPGDTQP